MTDNTIPALIVSHQALIAAEIARMEGMKATNLLCEMMNETPVYSDREFKAVTEDLCRLALSVEMLVK